MALFLGAKLPHSESVAPFTLPELFVYFKFEFSLPSWHLPPLPPPNRLDSPPVLFWFKITFLMPWVCLIFDSPFDNFPRSTLPSSKQLPSLYFTLPLSVAILATNPPVPFSGVCFRDDFFPCSSFFLPKKRYEDDLYPWAST